MKILLVHNHWLERGGEDEVVNSEIELLKKAGHEIVVYEKSNEEVKKYPFFKKLRFLIKDITWSKIAYQEVKEIVQRERPDIAHVHNTFIAISPSIYYALSEDNIPIVQTLHSYRLICPKGVLFRDAKVCQECIGSNFVPSVIHKCWRDSYILSYFLARTLRVHFKNKTFQKKIDCFIALSEFSKNKFIAAGIPGEKIFIKPNFTHVAVPQKSETENYALFVGRLVDYKGINTLISAYQKMSKDVCLRIIGAGPMLDILKGRVRQIGNIELLGRLSQEETLEQIKKASFVIFPSECYENMPRVILESFACGVPVVASNIGAIKELIDDKVNGLLFKPGNAMDLVAKIEYLREHKERLNEMGKNARRAFEEKYTDKRNYEILIDIYKRTINRFQSN